MTPHETAGGLSYTATAMAGTSQPGDGSLTRYSSAPAHRPGTNDIMARLPSAPLRSSSARHKAASAAFAHRRSMSLVDDLTAVTKAQVHALLSYVVHPQLSPAPAWGRSHGCPPKAVQALGAMLKRACSHLLATCSAWLMFLQRHQPTEWVVDLGMHSGKRLPACNRVLQQQLSSRR